MADAPGCHPTFTKYGPAQDNLRGHTPRFPDAFGEMSGGEAELLVRVLGHLAAGMRG